jgi:predicted anti-sigma-YlaC factor YlaD
MLDKNIPVHIHEDDLELYIRGQVESERLSLIELHLSECKMCQAQLSDCAGQQLKLLSIQGAYAGATQRRSEERFRTEGEAILQEIHPLAFERHKVKVVDVSRNGLGIISPKLLFPGTIVRLRIKNIVELGNVRYCAPLDNERFRIGLRLNGEG